MTAEQFLDKLDRFIGDTIGKEFEYQYEIEDADKLGNRQGVWFKGFWILGFDKEDDEPESYPYTHPIREIPDYSKVRKIEVK